MRFASGLPSISCRFFVIDVNFIYAIFQLFNWLTVGNTCLFTVLRSHMKGKMFGGFVRRVSRRNRWPLGARSFIHVSKRKKKKENIINQDKTDTHRAY